VTAVDAFVTFFSYTYSYGYLYVVVGILFSAERNPNTKEASREVEWWAAAGQSSQSASASSGKLE
jgi:hypothetical protein